VAVVFIFGQDEMEEGSTLGFLDKILAQLVHRKRTPSQATVSLYKSESFQNGRASAKAFQDAIRAEVNRFSRVFFVIDGIETPSEKERILNRLQKLPDHAQLLVMMREAKYDSKDEHLSVLAARDDLEAYITNRINEDVGLRSLLKEYPSELKTAVVQQVSKKCHGL
jgi:predicted transcriptional regulator